MEYSPIAALNRTYALSKANGKKEAIREAEKLNLSENHFYHSLLGSLYTAENNKKAIYHLKAALRLAKTSSDKKVITTKIGLLQN